MRFFTRTCRDQDMLFCVTFRDQDMFCVFLLFARTCRDQRILFVSFRDQDMVFSSFFFRTCRDQDMLFLTRACRDQDMCFFFFLPQLAGIKTCFCLP